MCIYNIYIRVYIRYIYIYIHIHIHIHIHWCIPVSILYIYIHTYTGILDIRINLVTTSETNRVQNRQDHPGGCHEIRADWRATLSPVGFPVAHGLKIWENVNSGEFQSCTGRWFQGFCNIVIFLKNVPSRIIPHIFTSCGCSRLYLKWLGTLDQPCKLFQMHGSANLSPDLDDCKQMRIPKGWRNWTKSSVFVSQFLDCVYQYVLCPFCLVTYILTNSFFSPHSVDNISMLLDISSSFTWTIQYTSWTLDRNIDLHFWMVEAWKQQIMSVHKHPSIEPRICFFAWNLWRASNVLTI